MEKKNTTQYNKVFTYSLSLGHSHCSVKQAPFNISRNFGYKVEAKAEQTCLQKKDTENHIQLLHMCKFIFARLNSALPIFGNNR